MERMMYSSLTNALRDCLSNNFDNNQFNKPIVNYLWADKLIHVYTNPLNPISSGNEVFVDEDFSILDRNKAFLFENKTKNIDLMLCMLIGIINKSRIDKVPACVRTQLDKVFKITNYVISVKAKSSNVDQFQTKFYFNNNHIVKTRRNDNLHVSDLKIGDIIIMAPSYHTNNYLSEAEVIGIEFTSPKAN